MVDLAPNPSSRSSRAARGAAVGAVVSAAAFVGWAVRQNAKEGVETQWGPLDGFAVLLAAVPGALAGAAVGAATHRE